MNWAALGGNLDIVKLAIEKGGDYLEGALSSAAYAGHLDIVNYLLEKIGVLDIDYINEAMEKAAIGGHLNIVKILVELGGDNFDISFFEAAGSGHLDIVKYFIDKVDKETIEKTIMKVRGDRKMLNYLESQM